MQEEDRSAEENAGEPAEALYNIGAVSALTGIPVATLQSWERRYGYPLPARTSGAHRRYTARQLEALRWIKGQVDAGVQVSQAIGNLQHMPADATRPAARAALPHEVAAETAFLPTLRQRLVAALLSADKERSAVLLGEALAVAPVETIVLEVIGPAMSAIGAAWQAEEIDVPAEHFATNYLRQRLLVWMETAPAPVDMPPAVLACAPGELHEGSLLMLGVLLRRRRIPVAYLGQSVPLESLAGFVRSVAPAAVVLVAMRDDAARALAEWPAALPELAHAGRPIVAYGGRAFVEQPAWIARVPGIYLGDSLGGGFELLLRLLRAQGAFTVGL